MARLIISLLKSGLIGLLAAILGFPAMAVAQTTPTPTTSPGGLSSSFDWTSWVLIAVVVFALFWILTRSRRGGTTPRLQSAINLISNVNDNLRIMQTHVTDRTSTKKFKTVDWADYQGKVEFLDPATADALKSSYYLMNEFNEKIEIARKTRNVGSLQELPIDSLREPLSKSKQGLQQWLRDNIRKEMGGRGGIFG